MNNSKGAGRKLKFGEPSKDIKIRIPASKEYEIKEKFNEVLELYRVNN